MLLDTVLYGFAKQIYAPFGGGVGGCQGCSQALFSRCSQISSVSTNHCTVTGWALQWQIRCLWENEHISEGLNISLGWVNRHGCHTFFSLGVLSNVWLFISESLFPESVKSISDDNSRKHSKPGRKVRTLNYEQEYKLSKITEVLLLCRICILILPNHSLLRTHYFLELNLLKKGTYFTLGIFV